jgi:hypothetical protein
MISHPLAVRIDLSSYTSTTAAEAGRQAFYASNYLIKLHPYTCCLSLCPQLRGGASIQSCWNNKASWWTAGSRETRQRQAQAGETGLYTHLVKIITGLLGIWDAYMPLQ